MTDTLICAYEPCSKQFVPEHWRQKFCTPTCRANQHYVDNPEKGRALVDGALRCVADHPLQAVRDERAEKKHNRDLGGLIRQAIVDTIKTSGSCHADDLIPLYPAGEVDLCRRLATAQFGSLCAPRENHEPLLHEKERRKSSIPERKGAKSGVYVFTKYGRETLIGSSCTALQGVGTAGAAGSGEEQEIIGAADAAQQKDLRGSAGGERVGCSGDPTPASVHPDAQSATSPPPAEEVAADAGSPPSPRSSSEEQRSSNPQAPGSNPGGGAQEQCGATRRSTNERTGYEDNPTTAGIARRPGRTEMQGDKSEVPAAAPEPLQLDDARRRAPSAFDPWSDAA